MPENKQVPLIVVVGNCCSGKTTLVNNLQIKGFNAYSCLQEHSAAPRMWQRRNPDIMVLLSCTVETAQRRREIAWGMDRWLRQRQILQNALENADLVIKTDELSIEEVVERAVQYIEQWRVQHEKSHY